LASEPSPPAPLSSGERGRKAAAFRVGGLTPLTTVEWDGKLAAVVFAQGCPWRCRYCHNTSLVPPNEGALIPWEEVLLFLQDRVGLVDGIVFSGGEPTAQAALHDAVCAARELGYATAVHTNGGHPRVLSGLLDGGLLDYVAMDIKAPFSRYHEVTRSRGSGRKAQESIAAIIRSGVDYEFRTTYHSDLLGDEEVLGIAQDLKWRGAETYFIQRYRWEGTGDMPLALTPSRDLPARLLKKLQGMFQRFGVRG
jgi:pyruvate formate lyase activating enzyme